MKDDERLNQQLHRPGVPAELEQNIRLNWQNQIAANQKPSYRLVVAGLVGILLGAYLVIQLTMPQDIVTLAIDDINSHAKQTIGMMVPMDTVYKQVKIQRPPESMHVQMSKMCRLASNSALHLEIVGESQGAVHLFIKQGDFNASIGGESKLAYTMPWKLIKPRRDLSVLVLYPQDMDPVNVDKLIQTMFLV